MPVDNSDRLLFPIESLIIPKDTLRGAEVATTDYAVLRDRLRVDYAADPENFQLEPIRVVRTTDPDKFEIENGVQRYSIFKELGISHIWGVISPVAIGDVAGRLANSIKANLSRIDTKHAAVGKALQTIIDKSGGTETARTLAQKIGTTEEYVITRLRLANTLTEDVAKMVDSGEVTLQNAKMLTRVPKDRQADVFAQIQGLPADAAATKVREVMEAINKAKSAGATAKEPPTFKSTPVRRTIEEISAEIENLDFFNAEGFGPEMREGYIAGLNFALSLDTATVLAKEKAFQDNLIAMAQKREAAKAAAKAKKAAQTPVDPESLISDEDAVVE